MFTLALPAILPALLLYSSIVGAETYQEPESGARVEVGGKLITTLPAAPRSTAQAGSRLYILTAEGELQVWELSEGKERRVSATPMPQAVALFVAGGRVWAELHETRAVPLDALQSPDDPVIVRGQATSAEGTTQGPQRSASAGHVTSVHDGTAVIDIGREAGLQPGTLVRFLGQIEVQVPRLDGSGTELRKVERETAAGRVKLVEDRQALVELWRGGRVKSGDRVESYRKSLSYLAAPERLGGIGETGLIVRPLLALDNVGVAFINELWTTWSFESPWYLSARLSPLGLGWSKEGNPLSVAALGAGGFDGRYFSVGLGAGWSMLNGDPSNNGMMAAEDGGSFGESVDFEDVDNAFSIVQEARLGARDGLYVSVRNTFILYPVTEYVWIDECNYKMKKEYGDCYEAKDQGKEFVFGGIAMRFGIPVGERTDVLVDWGTGASGATWVEGGVSTWLRGNGDKGSVALEAGAGYGNLEGQPEKQAVDLYGPMVSLGARWRW